jgi:hypothetical protein
VGRQILQLQNAAGCQILLLHHAAGRGANLTAAKCSGEWKEKISGYISPLHDAAVRFNSLLYVWCSGESNYIAA